jgi:hypothetical protein
MSKKLKLLTLILTVVIFSISCEHFERRKQLETNNSDETGSTAPRETYNKNKIRELEKKLNTKQEKQTYSKLLPWFQNDEERISYLNQPNFEDKQEWIQKSGILARQNSMGQKFKRLIDSQDIAIGMPNDLVKKSWGDPIQVEVSGNPLYKNEKWRYIRNVSSTEGFRQEKRVVYFENGKVVGWETE